MNPLRFIECWIYTINILIHLFNQYDYLNMFNVICIIV